MQHEYADIVDWYASLAQNYSNVVAFVSSIGKSVEGRDMPAVHITAATAANTPKIYFQCQIHARKHYIIVKILVTSEIA